LGLIAEVIVQRGILISRGRNVLNEREI